MSHGQYLGDLAEAARFDAASGETDRRADVVPRMRARARECRPSGAAWWSKETKVSMATNAVYSCRRSLRKTTGDFSPWLRRVKKFMPSGVPGRDVAAPMWAGRRRSIVMDATVRGRAGNGAELARGR